MRKLIDRPDEKTIYFWNLIGSVVSAGISVLLLMVVTRTLDTKNADIFSIGWAVAQLMLTIGTFQVRLYQATDVVGKYSFEQYLKFRVMTVAVMILCTGVYVGMKGYSSEKIIIIVLVCLYKVVDAVSDVYQGWFQLKERLDLAGKALTIRTFISFVFFAVTIWWDKNLLLGCIVLFLSSVVCFLVLDIRYYYIVFKESGKECCERQWFTGLFKTCFPLFVNSFLMMLIVNAPKMSIDTVAAKQHLSDGMQSAYGIIFMPASVVTLAFIVFRPMITQMALYWRDKKFDECNRLILKLILMLVGISTLVVIVGYFLGIPVLSFMYGVDLKNYKDAFIVLLIGGSINTLAYVFDNVLTVIRKQYSLVIAYGVSSLYSIVIGDYLVGKYEMLGAAFVYTSSMLLLLGCTVVLFIKNYTVLRTNSSN